MKPLVNLMLAGVFLLPSLSFAQDESTTQDNQEKELDPYDPAVQGSYAIGVNTGMQLRELLDALKQTDFVLYDEAVARGLVDGYEGNNAMDDQLFDTAMEWFNVNADAAIAKKEAALESAMEDESDANLQMGLAFLESNKSEKGVVTLPSGLQYKILEEGSGESPTVNDRVQVEYVGKLADGTVFDSTYERQVSTSLSLNTVIDGWKEALTLMKKGSKWTVFIPPELGYGEEEYDGVPANSVLIFDLELIDFMAGN